MDRPKSKPRVAVVSPFLDTGHGTERIVLEWISRLVEDFEIHLYSQYVKDMDLSQIVWHRIPKLPGPLLFSFLWWFAANHYVGLDHAAYNPARCSMLRTDARRALGLSAERFAVLTIGNDLRNKGFRVLLEALAALRSLPIDLLIVGREDPAPFREMALNQALGQPLLWLELGASSAM